MNGCRRHSEAVEILEGPLGRGLRDAGIYRELGVAQAESREYRKAFENWERGLELNPWSEGIYLAMGAAYEALREWGKAEECLRKVVDLNENNVGVYAALGDMRARQNDWNGAIRWWDEGLKADARRAGDSPKGGENSAGDGWSWFLKFTGGKGGRGRKISVG